MSDFSEGPVTPAMQHVQLPILSNEDCIKAFSRVMGAKIGPGNICAGYTNNKKHSTCQVRVWNINPKHFLHGTEYILNILTRAHLFYRLFNCLKRFFRKKK